MGSGDSSGLSYPNTFTSEFGVSGYSSFESMSGALDEKHWGIHGGMPGDTCAGGHDPNNCVGNNPMSGRNYPCDNIIEVYFGKSNFDLVGADAFKKQLWQCMMAQVRPPAEPTQYKRVLEYLSRYGIRVCSGGYQVPART